MTSHSEIKIPSERDRIAHLVTFHLQEMSWSDRNFLEHQALFLQKRPDQELSPKNLEVIALIENKHCGQICHAMNKTGVKHA